MTSTVNTQVDGAAPPPPRIRPVGAGGHAVPGGKAWLMVIVGAAAFYGSQIDLRYGALVVLFLYCAVRLGRVAKAAEAFAFGLALGVASYLPQFVLWHKWDSAAITSLVILVLAVGVFAGVAHGVRRYLPAILAPLFLAIVWTGLEWLRCEVGPTKFPWLTPGMSLPVGGLQEFAGERGTTFVLVLVAAAAAGWRGWNRMIGLVLAIGAAVGIGYWPTSPVAGVGKGPVVVGVNIHNAPGATIAAILDKAVATYPDVELLVVGDHQIEQRDPILGWAKTNSKTVLVATQRQYGDDPHNYHQMLVVVGPDGTAGAQFEKDIPPGAAEEGPRKPEESVWDSPWGKIGILSFEELEDRSLAAAVVRAGATGLIVPLRDVELWAREAQPGQAGAEIAAMRAAELRVPVARVAADTGEIAAAGGAVVGRSKLLDFPAPASAASAAATGGRGRGGRGGPVDLRKFEAEAVGGAMGLASGPQGQWYEKLGLGCAIGAGVVVLLLGIMSGVIKDGPAKEEAAGTMGQKKEA